MQLIKTSRIPRYLLGQASLNNERLPASMKLLTLNFLTCAIKTCKTNPASFPLHPRDAELEILEADINLPFLKNILPRLMWAEFRVLCSEVRKFIRKGKRKCP